MLGTLILVDLLRVHGGPDLARCRTNSISGNQGNISSFLNANTHRLPTAFLMQRLLLLHQRRLQLAPFQLKRGYKQWAASPVGFNPERHIQLDPTFSHFSLLWETKPSQAAPNRAAGSMSSSKWSLALFGNGARLYWTPAAQASRRV